jgi:hypothetical protein
MWLEVSEHGIRNGDEIFRRFNMLTMAPAYVITREEIDRIVQKLKTARSSPWTRAAARWKLWPCVETEFWLWATNRTSWF